MKDQYNNIVPTDLIMLGDPKDYTDEQLKGIDLLDWYKPRGTQTIFVSAAALEKVMGDTLFDSYGPEEIGAERARWEKIDLPLHRWTAEDGFYHA